MIADNSGVLPRYCHPYHGGWDVARIALNIPQSRILFLCPISCARIICLNAIKYGYKDRIDVLALTESDIVSGDYEQKTIDAACAVLERCEPRPRVLILYVSCIDAMLGNDHAFQTEEIMARYPDVNCFVLRMCPITRYSGDLPLVALQRDMVQALPPEKVEKEKTVAVIGSNIAFAPGNELVQLVHQAGYRLLHIQASEAYEDYLAVRSASLDLCMMPFGKAACELLQARYGTPYLPFLPKYDFQHIRDTLTRLCAALHIPAPDLDAMEAETRRILRAAAREIGGTELVIDAIATLFPDDLRRTLESCGFRVRRVYGDAVGLSAPDFDAGGVLAPIDRSYGAGEDVIAIGMVSASFEGADKAIDVFYDNGEWGHYGLRKLAERTLEAYKNPKTPFDLRREAVR